MDFIKLTKKTLLCLICIMHITSCNNKKEHRTIGVISSATPEATKAGQEIFLKGGNAIDAAIAISFALGVTEPAMSGLGGGTQVLLSLKNGAPFAVNGTTWSPERTPTNIKDTLTYHRRSTIPSTVKVLDYLWRNYGSGNLNWKDLLEPAINLAENGFVVGKFRAKVYQQYEEKLLESKFNTSFFLSDRKRIPKEREILKQPVLAKTLKRLAEFGADDFYNGSIARDIAEDMSKNNGWITLEDLKNFPDPIELKALSAPYKGMNVYSQPPPCGGWVALLALNVMEELSLEKNLTPDDIIKALYFAHNDRDNAPVTDLANYESMTAIKLSKDYSKAILQRKFIHENNNDHDKPGETTHFSVVDSQENAIAITASINAYFGALSASPQLGFLYNTYMDDFIFEDPDHPFAIRPNAMAYSSMTPIIVQNNGENVLVLGSPGSERIISSVAQITAKWIENNNIESLIKSPRIHVAKSFVYLEIADDSLTIDQTFLKTFDLQIKHPNENLVITKGLNAYFGGVHAIAKEKQGWIGVADPRRDGLSVIVDNNR